MAISFLKSRQFYESLPVPLKWPFGWMPFGVMAGEHYRRAYRRKARLDRASRQDVTAYQERELGRLLEFACEQCPAYQSLRSAVGRVSPFEALKAFPFLEKKTLQEHFTDYVPREIAKIPHWECTTGGTSGNQLRFYLDDTSHATELGFMHRQWARVGYTPRCRKATFRGVAFPNLPDGVYWQENPIYREMQFSPFHMSEKTLGAYIDELRRFRPQFLHGYPSAIGLLADYVLRHGIALTRLHLRAVLLASEALYPGQRDHMAKAFGCRAFSWYGHSERLILAGECETSSVYHQLPDYGIIEIADDAGNVIEEEGGYGELVGTGLLNRSMPLIRYRTEDYARKRSFQCACGRCFDRFDEVEGRWKQEYILGKTGARISPSALNMHGPIFDHVFRYQYYQAQPGVMELRLMATDQFNDVDAAAIRQAFAQKVGGELDVVLNKVENIPLTERGKLRRLVQEIPSI